LRKSKFLRTNAELLQRLYLKSEENFKSFKKITMMMPADSWKSRPNNSNLPNKLKNLTMSRISWTEIYRSNMIRSREHRKLSSLSSIM